MSTLRCRCSAVKIKLSLGRPLWRLECCCHDCTLALWYVNKYRNAPALPPHQLLDGLWVPNDFEVVSGLDEIGSYKNFESGDTTRFYCRKCWTCMMADHPAYGQRLVLTQNLGFTEYEGISGVELFPPRSRHFLKDLNTEKREKLPNFEGSPDVIYEGISSNFMNAMDEVLKGEATGAMNL